MEITSKHFIFPSPYGESFSFVLYILYYIEKILVNQIVFMINCVQKESQRYLKIFRNLQVAYVFPIYSRSISLYDRRKKKGDKMNKRTKLIMSQVMLPNQANPAGNVHGGEIMKLMDTAAGAAATKYARGNVVTARVDELQFHSPVFVGALVTLTATVAYVGRTSMEVIVTVDLENLESDSEPKRALSSYFTMVALDKNGKPRQVPPLQLDTEEEKTLYEEVKRRRAGLCNCHTESK